MDFFTSKAACRVFQKSAAKWCRTKPLNKKLLIGCSSQAETNVRSPLSAYRMKQKVKHSCCSAQSISILLIFAKNFRTQSYQTCGFQNRYTSWTQSQFSLPENYT